MLKVANLVFNSFVNDSRVRKTSISLSNNGYKVEVIAHLDKNLKEEEREENFRVRRFSYLDRKITKNKFKKIKVYLKYIRESISYCKEADILHCNDLNTLPIGVIIKKFFNKQVKIVYDAHEYETERVHQGKIEKKIVRVIEKKLLKYVDSVITVSNSIANEYVKLYGIKKPHLVFNTPNYKKVEKKDIFREKFNIAKDTIIFLYQGGVSKGRGILEFAELIKNKKEVAYVIMGYGALEEDIKKFVEKHDNVFFHEAVSPKVLLDYTSSADIGVCIEENLCKSWDYALPNKMFEYYMADLPIIVSGLYEMKKFVRENDTGFILDDIFNKEEFDSKFDTIIETYKSKQKNITRVKKIYNWEEQEKVLLNLYRKLVE